MTTMVVGQCYGSKTCTPGEHPMHEQISLYWDVHLLYPFIEWLIMTNSHITNNQWRDLFWWYQVIRYAQRSDIILQCLHTSIPTKNLQCVLCLMIIFDFDWLLDPGLSNQLENHNHEHWSKQCQSTEDVHGKFAPVLQDQPDPQVPTPGLLGWE